MMTSENQEKQTDKKKLYLIPAMVIVSLLVAGLMIRSQRSMDLSPASTSPSTTLQTTVPTVQYPTIPPSAPAFTVPIQSIGASGTTGRATFQDIAGTVAILLYLDGPAEEEEEESIMPVELRYGTCAAPGDLAYSMNPPDAGQSETDLSINLKELNAQKPMAVILYRSTQNHTAIACGDVR